MRSYLLFAGGLAVGFVAALVAPHHAGPAQAQPAPPVPNAAELSALKADVERLKAVATDQSHVMTDVAHQFSCLWFAGRTKKVPERPDTDVLNFEPQP
jgi:hypothetical protein